MPMQLKTMSDNAFCNDSLPNLTPNFAKTGEMTKFSSGSHKVATKNAAPGPYKNVRIAEATTCTALHAS